MAYIRGSPLRAPVVGGGPRGGDRVRRALARRLQAEEQGRPVARFELLDHAEARYKDPEPAAARGRGITTPRPSSTCSHQNPEAAAQLHAALGRRVGGPAVFEDYVRPAPAEPRERDGKRGLANARDRGAAQEAGGRRRRAGGRPPPPRRAGATGAGARRRDGRRGSPWTPEEEQHLQELVDEHGEGDWSWPTIAEELGTGRTKEAVEEHYNDMLERRRIPGAAVAAGDDQAQKLRINASGRVATLVQKKQRGWLVGSTRTRARTAPRTSSGPSANFVTLLDAAERRPHQRRGRRPRAGAAPAPAPRKRRPKDFAEGDRDRPESADSHGEL